MTYSVYWSVSSNEIDGVFCKVEGFYRENVVDYCVPHSRKISFEFVNGAGTEIVYPKGYKITRVALEREPRK